MPTAIVLLAVLGLVIFSVKRIKKKGSCNCGCDSCHVSGCGAKKQ